MPGSGTSRIAGARQLNLDTAQSEIASNWIEVYKKSAGSTPSLVRIQVGQTFYHSPTVSRRRLELRLSRVLPDLRARNFLRRTAVRPARSEGINHKDGRKILSTLVCPQRLIRRSTLMPLPSPRPETLKPEERSILADSAVRVASQTGIPTLATRVAIVPPKAPMPTINIRWLLLTRSTTDRLAAG